MGKRTRKQKKLRGGFWSKSRRGVLGNWWGSCDGIEPGRIRNRCLLDKERSLYEAHVPDPLAIYEDEAKKREFKSKIKRKNSPMTSKIDEYFEMFSTKELRDEARRLEKMGTSPEEFRKIHRARHPEKRNKITIHVSRPPYSDFNIEISNYATVDDLKNEIKKQLGVFNDISLYH